MSLKAFLMGLFLALFFSTSFALPDRAEMDGLTDVQKAEILKKIAEAKQSPITEATEKVDKVTATAQAWVGIGTQIGTGLASTAKELGIAANEFVQTPVGKWTAAIIIWKLIGNAIVHIGFGAFVFCVVLPAWIIFWRKRIGGYYRTPTDKTWAWGFFRCYETQINTKVIDGELVAVMLIGAFLISLVGLVTIFTL